MTQPDTVADKFVLLFSADWFRPHWPCTGFLPREGTELPFLGEMRDLARSLLDGATSYWDVNFSDTRLCKTRDALFDALGSYQSAEGDLALIRAMIDDADTAEAITAVSMKFWNNYEATVEEIRSADLMATEWDRGLADLTPGLPSYLQDFTLVTLLGGLS